MQRCQYCGFEFPENARFCSNCGRIPALNAAPSDPSAPANYVSQPFVPSPAGNQPGTEEEEERRRGGILPLPTPPTGGSFAGGQVPQVAGTPSLSGVPSVQGPPSSMASPMSTPSPAPSVSTPPSSLNPAGSTPSPYAPSAPLGASPAGQPEVFEQHTPSWSHAPAQQTGVTGPQYHRSPDQDTQGKEHHRHHGHRQRHGRRSGSRLLAGGRTKLILIAIIALLIVAGSVLALVLRSQSPGTTPVTTSKGTPTSTNRNASATATGTVTASPTTASSQASGTFNFTGAIPGSMVITSLPQCGVRGGTYFMQAKGTVGGTPFTFLIGLASYHGPGTFTSNLNVNLIKVGSFVAMSNNASLPVTITVTNNGKAGTVSSDLLGVVNPTSPQPATGHVSGNWTCV